MEALFKKGEKVQFIGLGKAAKESYADAWERWCQKDGVKVGGEYVIQRDTHGVVDLVGKTYSYEPYMFRKAADALVIVLRRPVDRKSIEKFLNTKGYFQRRHNGDKGKSRIIVVHFKGSSKGDLTYNAMCPYYVGTKQAAIHAVDFCGTQFGHKEVVVLKSKPSVNQVINQISKYL